MDAGGCCRAVIEYIQGMVHAPAEANTVSGAEELHRVSTAEVCSDSMDTYRMCECVWICQIFTDPNRLSKKTRCTFKRNLCAKRMFSCLCIIYQWCFGSCGFGCWKLKRSGSVRNRSDVVSVRKAYRFGLVRFRSREEQMDVLHIIGMFWFAFLGDPRKASVPDSLCSLSASDAARMHFASAEIA